MSFSTYRFKASASQIEGDLQRIELKIDRLERLLTEILERLPAGPHSTLPGPPYVIVQDKTSNPGSKYPNLWLTPVPV